MSSSNVSFSQLTSHLIFDPTALRTFESPHAQSNKMPLTKQVILTDKAPKPLSVLNQGLIVGDMVYCSGQVGTDPATGELVEGTVQERTVRPRTSINDNSRTCVHSYTDTPVQAQVLRNLSAVLEAGGSSLAKVIKCNVFLANMDDFAAVNEVYAKFFSEDPKPVSPSYFLA